MTRGEADTLLDELIDQLYESDRYIDLDLMAAIMDQGEAMVDRLIEVVEMDDDWPSLHALLMLIEMRAEKALPVISRALLEEPNLNEWVDTSGLDKFGPVAIDTLEAMVEDKTADWFPRAIAAGALTRIAARYPETYERVTALLRSLLPEPDVEPPYDEDPDIWNSIVSDLSDLRDPQAYELIGRLFDADLIDLMFIDREDYERGYRSTDPLYGVDPEPRNLLDSHRAMQEGWRRSEARKKSAATPPPMTSCSSRQEPARTPPPVTSRPSRQEKQKKKRKRQASKESRRRSRPKKKKKRR